MQARRLLQHWSAGMILALASIFTLSGCLGLGATGVRTPAGSSGPASPAGVTAIPAPWRGPAEKLAQRGFSQKQLEEVFLSPNLTYTSDPMAAKLRELYGIFYHSNLIKAIQERLYQLGYEVLIDGRGGSGTKSAIVKFQTDSGLTANGEVSEATLASLDKAMKTRPLRPLAGYRPPPAAKPSRTATQTQATNSSALAQIKAYYGPDRAIFKRMTSQYQVPGEVVAAIMWVETRYGNYLGKQKAATMLASMSAAASDFSVVEPAVADLIAKDRGAKAFLQDMAVKRGDWALNELAALITYSFNNGQDPTTLPGSIYGAVGWGQFMPSNLIKYAVAAPGQSRIDFFDKTCAIFSIGHYLKAHGWKGGAMTEDERRAVIMKYNKSGVYVNTVLYVADYLAKP